MGTCEKDNESVGSVNDKLIHGDFAHGIKINVSLLKDSIKLSVNKHNKYHKNDNI